VALRYEVVIEKEEGGRFRELLREFTELSFIELALSPGKYRYRVIPYDFLNRPAAGSDWVSFEVRLALTPELNDAMPVYFNLGENAVHTLNITGKNIDPDAEIELSSLGGIIIIPNSKNINRDGSSARLYFNNDLLSPGIYEVHIRNPGGGETRGRTITIAYPESVAPTEEPTGFAWPFDNIFISAAWMPLFPIYGEYWSSNDGENKSLSGLAVRIGISFNRDLFNFGIEAAITWPIFKTDSNRQEIYFSAVEFNLLAQRWFSNEIMALTLRVGIGYSSLSQDRQEKPDSQDESISFASFHVNIGTSFMWVFLKHIYLEAGIDYTHLFAEPSDYLRPWIGVGVRY
jgi:hypothetical protein